MNLKTMQEMADFLNVSKQTVFKYIQDNGIEPINKEARPFYYNKKDVETILAGIGKREEQEGKLNEPKEITLLKEQIEILTEEIEEYKRKEHKYETKINKLMDLLDKQQELSRLVIEGK